MRHIVIAGLTAVALTAAVHAEETAPGPGATRAEASSRGPSSLPFHDEIVVTATAAPTAAEDVPYTVDRLGPAGLEDALPRTLPEALAEVPGVMVQKTAHGQGSPFIRGFTGFRSLFLIDGVRLNNSVFRDGPNQYWSTVDPLGLDRVEVVKGPVSVLYGSDAVGGTVNALTRPVPAGPGLGPFGVRASYRYASAERSHVGRVRLDARPTERFRFLAGASLKDFGDLEAGGSVGRQPMTGYDEDDFDLKAELDLGPGRRIVLGGQHVEIDDAWRTHRTIFAVPWRGTTVGNELRHAFDQRRTLGYVQYVQQGGGGGLFDDLHASVSWHRQDEDRDRIRADGRRDLSGFEVATAGAWLRLGREAPRGRWSYGVELYEDRVDSFALDFAADGSFTGAGVQGPVADDATYRLWGAYLQRRVAIGPRLAVLAGGRYDRAEADAGRVADPLTGAATSLTGSWDEVVGNLRAVYTLGRERSWRLYGGVSEGFRAPNLSDLTRLDTARSNELETPSPDLEPESFLAWELGLRGGGARWSAGIALFSTGIDGLIVRTPTGRLIDGDREVTKRNAGDGFVEGVEMSGRLALSRRVELWAAATWLDGEVETFPTSEPVAVREPIDKLMPPTAHAGLRWSARERDLWLGLDLSVAARADRLSSADRRDTQRIPPGGTPGYTVVNLRGGWRLRPGLDLRAAVENLTDEEVRIHASGLNEPGRSLVIGIGVDL